MFKLHCIRVARRIFPFCVSFSAPSGSVITTSRSHCTKANFFCRVSKMSSLIFRAFKTKFLKLRRRGIEESSKQTIEILKQQIKISENGRWVAIGRMGHVGDHLHTTLARPGLGTLRQSQPLPVRRPPELHLWVLSVSPL